MIKIVQVFKRSSSIFANYDRRFYVHYKSIDIFDFRTKSQRFMYIISRSIDFDSTLNSIFYVHCSTSTFVNFRQFSNENVISVDQIPSELQVLLNKIDSLQYDLQFLGFLVTVARIIVAICISVIQSTAHRSTADFSSESYSFHCT